MHEFLDKVVADLKVAEQEHHLPLMWIASIIYQIHDLISKTYRASSLEEDDDNFVDEFIDKNWEFIYNLIDIHHVQKDADVKFLGKGADGVAFELPTHDVLKIFDSNAQNSDFLAKYLRWQDEQHIGSKYASGLPRVLDAGELATIRGKDIGWVIMDKLDTSLFNPEDDVSNSPSGPAAKFIEYLDSAFDEATDDVDWYSKRFSFDNPKYRDKTEQFVLQIVRDMIQILDDDYKSHTSIKAFEDYVNSKSRTKLNDKWFTKFLVTFVWSSIHNERDVNINNIGVDKRGFLIAFDT